MVVPGFSGKDFYKKNTSSAVCNLHNNSQTRTMTSIIVTAL